MAAEIPPQLQDQLAQLQGLQQQLQVTAQQRQQIEFQVKDLERALEELDRTPDDAPIYRSVGSLLLKTSGKEAVKKQLQEEKETFQVRLKTFEKNEGRLREKATELQSKVQAALRNLSTGGAPSKPAASKRGGG